MQTDELRSLLMRNGVGRTTLERRTLNLETLEDILTSLVARGFESLARIPRNAFEAATGYGHGHPLFELMQASGPHSSEALALETDRCLKAIEKWTETPDAAPILGWLENKKRELGKEPHNASGALAELRAFGTLLSTLYQNTYVPVRPISRGPQKTPDFAFGAGEQALIEVCCLRHSNEEAARDAELASLEPQLYEHACEAAEQAIAENSGKSVSVRAHAVSRLGEHVEVSASAHPLADGRTLTLTMSIHESRPYAPEKEGGIEHTIASRIAGKKASEQISAGMSGILWMDCCDSSWSLSSADTMPVNLEWKGMNLATTYGAWHAFYGQKDQTIMMERSPVGLEQGGALGRAALQRFPGRFLTAQGQRWSAAVLKCVDGLVVFENPHASVKLPFDVLRGLTSLRGYRPDRSFHRYAVDDESLGSRVAFVEEMLDYMALGNSRPTQA